MDQIELVIIIVAAVASVAAFMGAMLAASRANQLSRQHREENEALRRELVEQMRSVRQEMIQSLQSTVAALGQTLSESQRRSGELQDKRLAELNEQLTARNDTLQKTVHAQLFRIESKIEAFTGQSSKRLEEVRATVEQRLEVLRADNTKQLDQMRQTVDEKLQKTLNERLAQSFAQVSERLEQVYKGLGEMQTLANGVGDLKKVLSNVKTRGILGEIQLGAILEQILSPEQYEANVSTKKGSNTVVEYAVKLPGDGENGVWLPIDAKFPGDTYATLMDAYESAVPERIAAAGKELEQRIKGCAKDIRDKYIDPPTTTDFGIMFLPFEGLYAEVVRRGMVETLARDFRVNIAGPTTMAALLNSLQMGFQTLAIQKRSGEVWQVLGAVKTEFSNFNDILRKAQDRLRLANDDLDKLIGTRTRAIERKLRGVQAVPLSEGEAPKLLAEQVEELETV
ncbi:MAG: DNA recombination protein RmuC [Candidatus Fimivivens sp.]